ncbi:HGH1 homolog [Pelobates cultripes]|uniref:Protein HGH1 homolog n=1 Tax=Pelobates cultripes TaxID=61616 RepID=A0AAD1S2H7_PELCU|nr:HGH1 homolog [Pelobates cultripes]
MDPTMCQELLTFLTPETRADLKSQALEYILGLSGTREGRQTLCTAGSALLPVLLDLTLDASPAVIQDAYHVMVNLTSDSVIHQALLQNIPTLLPTLLERLRDPACVYADFACTALCNLSREEDTCRSVLGALHVEGMDHLLHMVSNPKYNPTARLEYLSPLICNLTQLPEGRTFILDRTRCIVQRLLPYTHSVSSTVRRGGVVGTLRNCCFNHTLPPDLQYLPEDKQRESDPDIRKMLIESIQLLCATPEGRRIVKQRGSYLIMRSLHSWETETDVRIACEKLVQVLISDEPAPGLENLLEVNIPAEVEEKLKLLDEEDEKAQQHTEGTSKENKVTI